MKLIFRYLILISLILLPGATGLTACSSGGDGEQRYSISFTENPVMAGVDGGRFSVTVNTSHDWTAASTEEWITDVTASGGADGTLSFSVEASGNDDFRDGAIEITVSGTSHTQRLTVRQMGLGEYLSIDPNPLEFTTEGGAKTVVVYAVGGWQIESVSHEWISVGRTGISSFVVTVETNFTGSELEGEIVLSDGASGREYKIPVTQAFDEGLFKGATTPMGRRFVHGSDGLVESVLSDEQFSVNEQVEALRIAYMSTASGSYAPFRTYLFDVALEGGTTLRMSTADDENSSIKTTSDEWTEMQIVRGQLAAMQNKRGATLDVLAGVNGDFCFGDAGYPGQKNLLQGVMYRDGVCLKGTFDGGAACTVFAVMDDGSARIMTQTQYAAVNKDDIAEAIGGRQLLLSAGENVSNDATLEPRTAVGVSRDGKRVVLLVVDGRRADFSDGASYPMMSKMFLSMDVWEAINLDGGGSSTFAVRRSTATPATENSFETLNRPTDNTGDRAIPNGIAIVKIK